MVSKIIRKYYKSFKKIAVKNNNNYNNYTSKKI